MAWMRNIVKSNLMTKALLANLKNGKGALFVNAPQQVILSVKLNQLHVE